MPNLRPFSRWSLAAITAVAMASATLGQSAFGVLASSLIAEFSVERWQIGLLATVVGFTGAFLSPTFGRATDRLGGVTSVRLTLGLGMLAMLVISNAPVYLVLLGGAFVTGLANGWANPATNALIVDNTAHGTRGLVTGVKQSGVQAGAFLGGVFLPIIVDAANWRVAYASFIVLPLIGFVGMWRRPHSSATGSRRAGGDGRLPTSVRWVALYGALTGLGVSSTITFLPLFAEESQGWTHTQAGMLVAGIGLVGVVARIVWGGASERWLGHGRTLGVLALLSTCAALLLALASAFIAPSWVLVPAALLFGSGASAWNAVGMLVVMDYSSPELVGRGTGLTMLGFLMGIGIGAPLMGLSVDRLGVYTPGWIALSLLFLASAVVAVRVHRTGTLASV